MGKNISTNDELLIKENYLDGNLSFLLHYTLFIQHEFNILQSKYPKNKNKIRYYLIKNEYK